MAQSENKPTIAVFIPICGLPSEVWSIRQCHYFTKLHPVIICWHNMLKDAAIDGIPIVTLDTPWKRPRSLLRRAGQKLGLAATEMPDKREKTAIRRALQQVAPAAILCHFAWTGIRVCSSLDQILPVIWHVHGRDVSASFSNAAYRAAFQKLLARATKVIAVGSFQLAALRHYGLTDAQGELIPCGAPLELFSRQPIPVQTGTRYRFITVGRLSPEKGVLETIRAFFLVQQEVPEVELCIVGDGELRQEAEELAIRLGISSRIAFTGNLPPSRVAEELSLAHVFLQHSVAHRGWVEGFGVTVTEAGASGLPLITSRLGGIPDQVFDAENGFLFSPGDIQTQASLMLHLIGDESLRYRMGSKAREIAMLFDSGPQSKKLEDVMLKSIAMNRETGTSAGNRVI